MKVLEYNNLDTDGLLNKYKKIISFIEKGDFYSAQVKKLRSSLYYAARLDITNRLLFQIVKYEGQKYALMLEIIRNHNYLDSRFLRGAKVDEEGIKEVDEKGSIEDNDIEEIKFIDQKARVIYFLNKAISFDEQQAKIYNERLPFILIGSAGSGKTMLALEKLKTLTGNILYTSLSSYLVNNSRKLYYANNYQNPNQELEFLSFEEFISTIAVPSGKAMSLRHFKSWYQRHNIKKISADKIYEEFKGTLTGVDINKLYLTKEEYMNLGVRQSLFLNDEKEKIYNLFLKYLDILKKDYYDLNMVSFEYLAFLKKQYDYVVIDEVQDLTNVQIKLLLNSLNDKDNFILCGDSNQIVHPNFFSWSKVRSLFYQEIDSSNKEILCLLTKNYRNSTNIISIANDILKIKQKKFGSIDKESNYLINSLHDKNGEICIFNKKDKELKILNSSTRRSTKFAVIVLNEEMKLEAKKHFENPLLFTIQEAKGLEYTNIILFNLVGSESKKYQEIASDITKEDLEKKLVYARAKDKKDKSAEIYKFYINAFYVAVTRAIENLYIVEENINNNFLKSLDIPQYTGSIENIDSVVESNIESWQKEASELEKQGKMEQADNIRKEILNEGDVPWDVISDTKYTELKNKVFNEQASKQEKIELFEYCLICEKFTDIWKLRNINVKAAHNLKKSYNVIKEKYFSSYKKNSSENIIENTRLYGLNYKDRFNQTPIIAAIKLGNAELIKELVNRGVNTDIKDNNGLTCLQSLLNSIMVGIAGVVMTNEINIHDSFSLLGAEGTIIKVDNKLLKLDPNTMEFFLYNCIVALMANNFGIVSENSVTTFNAEILKKLLSNLPDNILKPNRKKRNYISGMLSKNEKSKIHQYNRRLFIRIKRGAYKLNPDIEIKCNDEWVHLSNALQ